MNLMLSNDSVFVFHLGQLNPIFWYHIKDVYFAGWNEGQSFRAPGCHIYGSFTLLGSYSTKVWMLNLILKHLSLTMGTMGTLWLLFDWSISCAAERFFSEVGGADFGSQKWHISANRPVMLARGRGCLRGDVASCYFNSTSVAWGVFYCGTGQSKKWRDQIGPPVWKVEGPPAP